MELIGKVIKLGNLTSGTSSKGEWRKQDLIIETEEQYPKKVCVTCWGDRVSEAQNLQPGQLIKVQISIESREFNEKWYTDVRAYRFDSVGTVAQPTYSAPYQSPTSVQAPIPTPAPTPMSPHMAPPPANSTEPFSDLGAQSTDDDLPF